MHVNSGGVTCRGTLRLIYTHRKGGFDRKLSTCPVEPERAFVWTQVHAMQQNFSTDIAIVARDYRGVEKSTTIVHTAV